MAGKRIEYQIGFTADTSSLQKSLDTAMKSLQSIGTNPKLQLTQELRNASTAALDLSNHLRTAFNQQTGKLDLVTFNNNLKQSGQTLEQYADKIVSIGPAGEQAFLNVAQAISKAELPVRRTSQLFDSLWTTMKNTMKWQLTSSIMHGFIGAVQTAYGYTKSLNESLNSIRIVTQKSAEDMDIFAEKANKAAKALSTTTTNYTDASLIYFQQGLDEEQVLARTETTIKLANVARESAETASQQLTAIWNNFYNGSKTLEYYADVMTALGASTASSTQEISTGLQKFAAIADTVGLSYEYAASALATITATTRESAEIVGTSLRTLFARIQGLLQDEEQEDGTNLNKYSKALAQVGINIKDTTGELKGMDQILNEMAATWGTLTNAQQMALAQTVAGVRQYTQLITLMEHWGDFQENLTTAINSEGTLQAQADIYAESWEAARARVRASMEDIYDSLINDDFYIGLDNAFTPILSGVADMIDALGGMRGVLAVVGLLMNQIYGDKIAQGMRDMVTNLGIISGLESERARSLQAHASQIVQDLSTSRSISEETKLRLKLLREEIVLQGTINEKIDRLDASQRQWIEDEQYKLQLLKQQSELYLSEASRYRGKINEKKEILYLDIEPREGWQENIYNKIRDFNRDVANRDHKINLGLDILSNNVDAVEVFERIDNQLTQISTKRAAIDNIVDGLRNLDQKAILTDDEISKLNDQLNKIGVAPITGINQVSDIVAKLGQEAKLSQQQVNILSGSLKQMYSGKPDEVNQYVAAVYNLAKNTDLAKLSSEEFKQKLQELQIQIQRGVPQVNDFASQLVKLGTFASQAAMGLNAIRSLGRVFSDENLTGMERMIQALTAFSMLLPLVTRASKALTNQITLQIAVEGQHAIVQNAGILNSIASKVATEGLTKATEAATAAKKILTAEEQKAAASSAALGAATAVTTGIIIAAVAALVILYSWHKKHQQALLDSAQASIDKAKATKEEIESNRELVQSMQNALDIYEETGENKSELDDITRQLAENYKVEGSALAQLTGKYEDYETVLDRVKEKQKEEARQAVSDAQLGIAGVQTKIDDIVKNNKGLFKGLYEGRQVFQGYEAFGREERDAVNILEQYLGNYGRSTHFGTGFKFSYDKNDIRDTLNFYEQLSEALDHIKQQFTTTELAASGVYQQANNLRNSLKETIAEAKDLVELQDEANAQAGWLEGQTITDDQISNLQEYRKWVEEVTNALIENGNSEEYAQERIKSLVDNSVNPAIDEFRILSEAIDEVNAKLQKGAFDEGKLENIFTSGNYETDVLANLNWAFVNEGNFEERYNQMKQYVDATNNATDASNRLAESEKALDELNKALKKSGGEWTEEILNMLSAFDYGESSFEDFLSMAETQQKSFFQNIINKSFQELVKSQYASIKHAKELIATYQRDIASIDAKELQYAQNVEAAWNKATIAWHQYQNAKDKDKFDISNFEIDWTKINGNWDDLKKMTQEELEEAVEEGMKDVKPTLDQFEVSQQAINDLENYINNIELEIAINAKLNFENQLKQIESSVDDIISVFDALKNGVTYDIDEMGNAMWKFSLDAVKAIDAMYPEFMDTMDMMADGTFVMTDEMYQAFFNAENGILAADAQAMGGILQNNIELLQSKKETAQAGLEVAEALANGEVTLAELSNEQRVALLSGFEVAQETSNGNLLKDQVELLDNEDNNWESLFVNIGVYSAEGASNMANNFANATDSMLEDLKQIQDAIADVDKAMSNVGTGNVAKASFSTTGARMTASTKISIDTSNTEKFIKTYSEAIKTTDRYKELLATSMSEAEALSRAVGESQAALQKKTIASIDKSIDANRAAYSKLLSSIDSAYDSLKKSRDSATKSSKSKADSAKEAKEYEEEELRTIEEIAERYYEINREIERQKQLLSEADGDLEKENEILEKQLENWKEKLRLSKEYLTQDRAYLQELFGGTVAIDWENLTGEITNRQELWQQMTDEYNAFVLEYDEFINWYNNLATTKEQEANEELKKSWDAQLKLQKDLYEARKKGLKQYDDDLDVISDIYGALNDVEKQIKKNVEALKDVVKYEKEHIHTLEEIEERYRDINREIKAWKVIYDEADGDLEKELEILQKQLEIYKQKVDLNKEYIATEQQNVQSLFNGTARFDSITGELLNYKELLALETEEHRIAGERYNDFIEWYNNLETTKLQEQYAELKKQKDEEYKKEEEIHDLRIKALEQLTKELDIYWDMRAAIDDVEDSIQDKIKAIKEAKKFEEEELHTLEEIEERYHKINRAIKKQQDILDDISDSLDRAYGQNKLTNFQRQLTALESQLDKYNKKLGEANQWLVTDGNNLYELFGGTPIFGAYGELVNYEQLLQQIIDDHTAFNKSYDEQKAKWAEETANWRDVYAEEIEEWEKRNEEEDELYEKRQEAIKQYEETLDEIQDIYDALEDLQREIADNKLQELEYKLEIVLDVKSMQDAIRDFQKKSMEIFGDIISTGSKFGDQIRSQIMMGLSTEQMQSELNMYYRYKEQYEELKALYESNDPFMDRDQIIQDIQDLQSKVLSSGEAILDWINSIEDMIPAAVDAARKRYDEFLDQLQHNETVLSTIKELYALQGVTYKTLDGFNRLQKVTQERMEAQIAQARLQKKWYDEARIRLEEAQARLDSLNGDETDVRYDTYKKARDAYLKEANEAEQAYLSLAKEAMETAKEMYLEQLDRAIYEFDQKVSKGLGLDLLQDKYDHYIEEDERYLDKVNEAYEVQAWYAKLQEDIDKTSNQAMKNRLKDLQKEIDLRREGNTLSKYDLEILEAKYKVLQAQMALDDAQNAKNQLQLVRDSQGNWNYQYTANPEDIANAEQDLLEAERNAYNIAKEQVKETTREIIQAWQDCKQAIEEIYRQMADGTITYEEGQARLAEITRYYTEKIEYLEREKQIAIKDMTEEGNQFLIHAAIVAGDTITDLTGLTAEDIKQIVEQSGKDVNELLQMSWDEIQQMTDENGQNVLESLSQTNERIKDLFDDNGKSLDLLDYKYAQDLDEMTNAAIDFEDILQDVLGQCETDFENFQETIEQVAEETGTTLEDLAAKTDEVSDATDRLQDAGWDAADMLWDLVDRIADAAYSYADLAVEIWGVVEALKALADAQVEFVQTQATQDTSPNYTTPDISFTPSSNPSLTPSNPTTSTSDSDWSAPDYSTVMVQKYRAGDWQGVEEAAAKRDAKLAGGGYAGAMATDEIRRLLSLATTNHDAEQALQKIERGEYYFNDKFRQYLRGLGLGFDTGGYTGEFNDAKLAFLHEKELVLNQDDTKNILDAVNIVRGFGNNLFSSIEKILDGATTAAISLMTQKLGISSIDPLHESIEQTIHIDSVEFPNVTSSDEIQNAFISLANDAIQYAKVRKV